ncbi:MAG TPA: nucleoside triphosphate pyrophosphohydrolase [Steroidobacteraceae bacterium]|jgi:MazG family protein|nr:nucleoside triphosphate pyrophosphohydrolase [Steroidobacteraceae bacterium]
MAIERLLAIMSRLRDPERGCPWDLQQDFRSIAPHTLEEAYEVADAIERDDLGKLRDELGDLLFQVAFHARLAQEQGAFAFDDVVDAISDKLTRRHPHVFGDATVAGAVEQTAAWERMKREERAARGDAGALADIPAALPALTRARKLGARASQAGFDWPSAAGPRAKVSEELAELDASLASGDAAAREAELGDLLFSIVNLARHLDLDPESALRRANERFARRYRHVERELERLGQPATDASPELLDRLWVAAKAENP